MTLENVEDPFKNRLSFSFHNMGDWTTFPSHGTGI